MREPLGFAKCTYLADRGSMDQLAYPQEDSDPLAFFWKAQPGDQNSGLRTNARPSGPAISLSVLCQPLEDVELERSTGTSRGAAELLLLLQSLQERVDFP
ncbi:hypothetical protein E5288_WYG004032 [Bos mutus]|uniref:Uncharacterized protein n=1 Tax=Bos mutus TaxID=72004 RepID=A0A6B0RVT3_9CETA|nr:hypothetical protein [Bos mutus]